MANLNRPFGLRFHSMLTGDAANVSIRRYRISHDAEAHAVFVGDPVAILSAGSGGPADQNLNQMSGMRYVERAAGTEGAPCVGVVVGFAYDPTNLNSIYYAAAATADRDVFVCDDPNALFEIQSDVTGITAAQANMNCVMTMTVGSTVTGVSQVVASGPVTASATMPLKIMGFVQSPLNDLSSGEEHYVRIVVKINNHQYGSHTGTVGV
jgi:hypothetical protein